MGDASELIYKLKPVTYRFKEVDVDPNKDLQPQNLDYGLIAEDVAEIDPKLAIRDAKGQIESLRYVAIYNMMLNEFLKEHGRVQAQQIKIEKQEATITELRSTVAQQQQEIETVIARLKEHDSKIQKVSAEFEMSRPAAQTVLNNR